MLEQKALREELKALEALARDRAPIPLERLWALAPDVRQWAHRTGKPELLRRLARLFELNGGLAEVLPLLQSAHRLNDRDPLTVLAFSRALARCDRTSEALAILQPLLAQPAPDATVVARAAELARKLGDTQRSLEWRREAAARDSRQLPALIEQLVAANDEAEALRQVRAALEASDVSPELLFRCYVALRRFSPDETEVCKCRDRLVFATSGPSELIWRARLYRFEGQIEEALDCVAAALAAAPRDIQLRRIQISLILDCGDWGRDARALLEAVQIVGPFPEIEARLAVVDKLLRAFGGSLAQAAAWPEKFADVRSPESVFEHITRTTPPPARTVAVRPSIAMIGHSLGAGGAERVFATCFRHVNSDWHFQWAKLYLFDLRPEARTDFYLPQTGITHSDVVLLNRDAPAEEPVSWLPIEKAKTTQAVLDQLRRDQPDIVHIWQEPLTVAGGIAAVLAGIPRIILHTHNMNPGELLPDKPTTLRLRGCYEALLRRPEVFLVCCADAAAADYANWLGLADRTKILTLHNGMEFEPAQTAEAEAAKTGKGAAVHVRTETICPNSKFPTIVGTAFRFAKEKRPLQWVDAAALVAAKRQDVRFTMYGDGKLRMATQAHIQAKGLADRVDLPGLVTDLNRRLPLLTLFVLSSRTEALPNVLIEAQAAGVPVIAYDVGGVRETMIDGVTGLLVRQDTPEALAGAVLRALSDPEWISNASRAGRAFVTEQFSSQRMTANLSALLLSPYNHCGRNPRPAAVPQAHIVR